MDINVKDKIKSINNDVYDELINSDLDIDELVTKIDNIFDDIIINIESNISLINKIKNFFD